MSDQKQRSIFTWLEIPWHFVGIVIFFMMRGYFVNSHMFSFDQVILYTLFALVIAIGLFFVAQLFLLPHNAGLLISVGMLLFFTYGVIYENLAKFSDPNPVTNILLNNLTAIYVGLILILIVLLYLQKRQIISITTFLNILVITLLVNLLTTTIEYVNIITNPQASEIVKLDKDDLILPETPPENLPDVYYLILDGYPANSYLETHFGVDNSPITQALENLGFYVAYDSLANYTYTVASVGSALNLDYIQSLTSPTNSMLDILELAVDNKVALTLKELGYDYITISAGFFPYGNASDLIIDIDPNNEPIYLTPESERPSRLVDYKMYFYQTSFLRVFDPTLSQQFTSGTQIPENEGRVVPQFEALASMADYDSPKFVFFHAIKPHDPVNVDRNGDPFYWTDHYSNLAEYWENEDKHFEDQLNYVNEVLLDTIEHILNNSDEPPIIIIQGDHAMQLTRKTPPDQILNRPLPIFNAYYFPDQDYRNLREDIRPVNSFRVVLNQYFGIDYELLPEKSYFQLELQGVPEQRYLDFKEIAEGQIEPPYSTE